MPEEIKNITQDELQRALTKRTIWTRKNGKAILYFPNTTTVQGRGDLVEQALHEIIDHILAERRAYIENYEGDGKGFENF